MRLVPTLAGKFCSQKSFSPKGSSILKGDFFGQESHFLKADFYLERLLIANDFLLRELASKVLVGQESSILKRRFPFPRESFCTNIL